MIFIKRHWSTILLAIFIVLLFIPQTGMPIKVFFQRLVSHSPSEIVKEERQLFKEYNWQLTKLEDQKEIKLSQSKEKVVLINFWATWCPPCIAEMASLQSLYEQYGREVDFYFISSEKPDKLKEFMEKKKYSFPVYIQTYQSPELLRNNSIPATYVISKEGEIVIQKIGSADWDTEKVHEILSGLLKN